MVGQSLGMMPADTLAKTFPTLAAITYSWFSPCSTTAPTAERTNCRHLQWNISQSIMFVAVVKVHIWRAEEGSQALGHQSRSFSFLESTQSWQAEIADSLPRHRIAMAQFHETAAARKGRIFFFCQVFYCRPLQFFHQTGPEVAVLLSLSFKSPSPGHKIFQPDLATQNFYLI